MKILLKTFVRSHDIADSAFVSQQKFPLGCLGVKSTTRKENVRSNRKRLCPKDVCSQLSFLIRVNPYTTEVRTESILHKRARSTINRLARSA
jgi:hypothetical protein